MKVAAIIPCAGLGTRMGMDIPKALLLLKGQPLFVHTLRAFEKSALVKLVVVVVQKDQQRLFKSIISKSGFKKVFRVVIGGETRAASVFNGLKALRRRSDIVVIHDGARPLVSPELIDQSVRMAKKDKAVVVAVPVKPTIKKANSKNNEISETLDRSHLWEAQTPQTFQYKLIVKAHQKNSTPNATDDSVLIEKIGIKVKILRGDYNNIKVTTKEDLVVAEGLLSNPK